MKCHLSCEKSADVHIQLHQKKKKNPCQASEVDVFVLGAHCLNH